MVTHNISSKSLSGTGGDIAFQHSLKKHSTLTRDFGNGSLLLLDWIGEDGSSSDNDSIISYSVSDSISNAGNLTFLTFLTFSLFFNSSSLIDLKTAWNVSSDVTMSPYGFTFHCLMFGCWAGVLPSHLRHCSWRINELLLLHKYDVLFSEAVYI